MNRALKSAAIAFLLGLIFADLSLAQSEKTSYSASELVARALSENRELAAVRLDIERARARLRQAELFENPVLEIEQTGGPPLGPADEDQELRTEFSLPLDFGPKRRTRLELARVEVRAVEAQVVDRERTLAAEVRTLHAQALAAARDLEFTRQMVDIDAQLGRVLEARVREGDAPPLELSLLRVEADRFRSRRAILEGRLDSAVILLKNVSGIESIDNVRLGGDLLVSPQLSVTSPEEAVRIAMARRPDLLLADLNVKLAEAGRRIARAGALPDVSVFASYSKGVNEVHPVGIITDEDNLAAIGVGLSIPLFNRNQGAQAEAEVAIDQARRLKEFTELRVRAEVETAFVRLGAAEAALAVFQEGVLDRSTRNVQTVRAVYEAGNLAISDVLLERRRLVDAQREFTEALTERAVALAELEAAVGWPITMEEGSNAQQITSR